MNTHENEDRTSLEVGDYVEVVLSEKNKTCRKEKFEKRSGIAKIRNGIKISKNTKRV